ncbi:MAG: hypothetical protein WBF53_01785 [Litorimonas sp.]
MNVISHYRALSELRRIHKNLDTPARLTAIGTDATNGVANASSQIQYRQKIDSFVEELRDQDVSGLLVYENQVLEEIGFDYLLPHKLALQIENLSGNNQNTLGVVGKVIADLSTKITDDLARIDEFIDGLDGLDLGDLDFGEAEAVFTVYYPTSTFDSALNSLALRFKETHGALTKILSLSGQDEDLQVLYISSGSALLVLGGSLGATATFALVLERLSSAFEKYQRGMQLLEQTKAMRATNAEAQAKFDAATDAAVEVNEEMLLEEIQTISIELSAQQQENAEVGITAGIKTVIEHMKMGIDYDVLADEIDESEYDDHPDVIESMLEQARRINKRDSRKNIKLIREVERKIIKRIEARKTDDS